MTTLSTADGPRGRDTLALSLAQLRAIEQWNEDLAREVSADSTKLTREMRLDLSRRMQARRREQSALLARAAVHLAASGEVMRARPVRAVLAHRNDWLRDGVAARLAERGIEVVGVFQDGADAAGTLVAEQPDLLLVEDRLPTLTGMDVVRRARRFAPAALIGVHVLDGLAADAAVAAGARMVFARRTPPAVMADELADGLAVRASATPRARAGRGHRQ